METIVQRLERLHRTDNWNQNDKEWLAEYLKGDISELYLISLEDFRKDLAEKKMLLDDNESNLILNNIHNNIRVPKHGRTIGRLWIGIAVAASISGIVVTGFLLRKQLENWINPPVKYEEAIALKGELKLIQLADGTNIWLNADSKLRYPDRFKENTREVTLSGEAFFKVAHKEGKPFIIHSGKINTTVLGTSFNIKAYSEDKAVKVTVVTGKVGVSVKEPAVKRHIIMLTPNMQLVFVKTTGSLVSKTIDDASSVMSWQQGKLKYHNAPLSEVIADLQRKYNVLIKADKNLLNCTLYADFDNLPLQKVLKLIGAIINAHAIKEGNGYRLKGKGCN